MDEGTPRLRVLISDGPGVRLDDVTRMVAGLGHDVIARESSLPDIAHITATEQPDDERERASGPVETARRPQFT